MHHWEYAFYAVGLLVTLAGVSSTAVSGWVAFGVMVAGIAVFATGIVVEERRYARYSVRYE